MGLSSFVDEAPCRNSDPWLFDQHQIDLAMPALQICKGCPFWQNCNSLVEPKSNFFDGVCAGKVWRNGRVLAKLDSAFPNRLIVGEELDEETMAVRGSELLGSGDGLLLPRAEQSQSGDFVSEKDLQHLYMENRMSDLCATFQSAWYLGRNNPKTKRCNEKKTKHNR